MAQHRGRPGVVRAVADDRRPAARGQRQDPRDERAHRRGHRPRAARPSTARGWRDDTDIIFTTDHGELQGDFGLLFKGPFHCEALMRLPMIWSPAPSAGLPAGVVVDRPRRPGRPRADVLRHRRRSSRPSGCRATPSRSATARGTTSGPSPSGTASSRNYGHHLRSIYRDGWVCTAYEPSTGGQPNGLEEVPLMQPLFGDALTRPSGVQYDGTEGELYNVVDDPHQFAQPVGRPRLPIDPRRPGGRPLRHPRSPPDPPARGRRAPA